MKAAIVLLSGGLDSATCLAIARSEGFETYALSFDYGQRHRIELECGGKVAQSLGAKEYKVVRIDLRIFGGSALTADIEVPKNRSIARSGIPITYVPARNTIFLSFALAYCEVKGASAIFAGVNAVDYSGYPDCRPEYIRAYEKMANLATKSAIEGNHIQIHTPLISLSKSEIIEKGLSLGVDYGLTSSCYDPGIDGTPCGQCDSCQIRSAAFKSLGLHDPRDVAGS